MFKESFNSKELVISVNGKKRRSRVEVFIFNIEGNILSRCRQGEYPELPGGGININEYSLQTAVRESMEESGWVIDHLTQLNITNNIYIDNTKDDIWFTNNEWDEEIEYAVLANAVKYAPNSNYIKSKDSLVFDFYSIERIINDTQEAIARSEMSSLRLWHASFRLQALEVIQNTIFPITRTRVLERPIMVNW